MSQRGLLLLVLVGLILVLAAIGGRLAMINRLGGVPGATETEAALQRLDRDPMDPDAARALERLGAAACPTITNYLCFVESPLRTKLRERINGLRWLKWTVHGEADYRRMAELGAKRLPVTTAPYLVNLFADVPLLQADQPAARKADLLLSRLGRAATPSLRDGLKSLDPTIRGHCALAVANHSELQDPALAPDLAALAGDRDAGVRAAAMLAMGRLLEGAEETVAALARGLADDASVVRFHAAHSLWALGAQAKPALPAFLEAIAREPGRQDEGMDDRQPLGPKSRAAILHALTNAQQTIREHGD